MNPDIINNTSKSLPDLNKINKNTCPLLKVERFDMNGNLIKHGGNQKISFIDKISKTGFVEIIDIDNYKKYNKMETPSPIEKTGCCIIY